MRIIEQVSFSDKTNFSEFLRQQFAEGIQLISFYVFEGVPDEKMLNAIGRGGDREILVMLDKTKDRGFMHQYGIVTDIASHTEKMLADITGVLIWTWFCPYSFSSTPEETKTNIEYCRKEFLNKTNSVE